MTKGGRRRSGAAVAVLLAAAIALTAGTLAQGAGGLRGSGAFQRIPGGQVEFGVQFSQPVTGFDILVSKRAVTSHATYRFACKKNPLVDGRFRCRLARRSRANEVLRGLLGTAPAPKKGVRAVLYGRQGKRRTGPFRIVWR